MFTYGTGRQLQKEQTWLMHVKLPTWTLHGNLAFRRQLQYISIAAGILIAQCSFTQHFSNPVFREVAWIQVRTVNPISQEFNAEQLTFQQPPPSPTESLNNKPSKQTLQNSVIHLVHKNSMNYIDLMNTHSLTGKLKVHTARVWHPCSKPVIWKHEKTSEEKYIPCWFCTAVPQVFNTRPRKVKPSYLQSTLQYFRKLRFSTTSMFWVFWSI